MIERCDCLGQIYGSIDSFTWLLGSSIVEKVGVLRLYAIMHDRKERSVQSITTTSLPRS